MTTAIVTKPSMQAKIREKLFARVSEEKFFSPVHVFLYEKSQETGKPFRELFDDLVDGRLPSPHPNTGEPLDLENNPWDVIHVGLAE